MKRVLITILPSVALSLAIAAVALPAFASTTIFASSWVSLTQGLTKLGTPVGAIRSDPNTALGAPDGQFVSLGIGGNIVLAFDQFIGSELSIIVSETTWGTYPLETANVYVSADGVNFSPIGTATNELGSGTSPHQTTFDLGDRCIKYVKIVDTTDPAPFSPNADGFDLDAVSATYTDPCCCGGPVVVKNRNRAHVTNGVTVIASTGANTADGGPSGSAGNGGSVSYAGSSTGGAGGDGGNGGDGGTITTGAASASSSIVNRINRNVTRIWR